MSKNKSGLGSAGKGALAVILARGGSKGIPKKNIQLLEGEPLVVRAIRFAKEARLVTHVIVSTDDPEIAALSVEAGAEVPFVRPQDLSGDFATTEDALKHAILSYEAIIGQQFKYGVFLTATDIFRKSEWIDTCIQRLDENSALESVFVGTRTHKNYWEFDENIKSWVRLRDWMAVYSSRQVRKPIFREDTGLACASRAWLWREGKRIGDTVDIIENEDDYSSIDIHTPADLQLARAAIKIRELSNG